MRQWTYHTRARVLRSSLGSPDQTDRLSGSRTPTARTSDRKLKRARARGPSLFCLADGEAVEREGAAAVGGADAVFEEAPAPEREADRSQVGGGIGKAAGL